MEKEIYETVSSWPRPTGWFKNRQISFLDKYFIRGNYRMSHESVTDGAYGLIIISSFVYVQQMFIRIPNDKA